MSFKREIYIGIIFTFLCVNYLLNSQDIAPLEKGSRDWIVKVVLTNGSEIKGVVLGDRFVEKAVYGHIYKEIDNYKEKGAGIRVWYVRNNPGFVFLPYKLVKRVVKLGRLSLKERKIIEDRIRMKLSLAQKEDEELRKKRLERLKKAGIGITAEEEKRRLEAEKKRLERLARQRLKKEDVFKKMPKELAQLLKDYPPEQGWGEDLFQKLNSRLRRSLTKFVVRIINGRKVIQKTPPRGGLTKFQKRFVDNFDKWVAAVNMYKREEKLLLQKLIKEIKKEEEKNKKKKKKEEVQEVELAKKEEKKGIYSINKEKNPKKENIYIPPQQKVQNIIKILLYDKSEEKKVSSIMELLKLDKDIVLPAIPSLRLCLKDPSLKVRLAALKALTKIKRPENVVLDSLCDALELGDVAMRREAAAGFMMIGKEMAKKRFDTLTLAVGDDDPIVKYRVIRVLESIGDKKAIRDIQQALWDEDNSVRVSAAVALLRLDPKISLKYAITKIFQWIGQPLFKGIFNDEFQVRKLASEGILELAKQLQEREDKIKDEFKNKINTILEKVKDDEIRKNLEQAIDILTPQEIEEENQNEEEGDLEDIYEEEE